MNIEIRLIVIWPIETAIIQIYSIFYQHILLHYTVYTIIFYIYLYNRFLDYLCIFFYTFCVIAHNVPAVYDILAHHNAKYIQTC
jgi:hypothetical protein